MSKNIERKDSDEVSFYKQAYLDMLRKNVEKKPLPERTMVDRHIRSKSGDVSQKR